MIPATLLQSSILLPLLWPGRERMHSGLTLMGKGALAWSGRGCRQIQRLPCKHNYNFNLFLFYLKDIHGFAVNQNYGYLGLPVIESPSYKTPFLSVSQITGSQPVVYKLAHGRFFMALRNETVCLLTCPAILKGMSNSHITFSASFHGNPKSPTLRIYL